MRRVALPVVLILLLLHSAAFAQSETPLTLDEALETALQKNRSLAADQYDKQASHWRSAQSISGYLPKVFFVSSWTRLDQESVDNANAGYESAKQYGFEAEKAAWENMYNSYITVAQPIFNQGRELSAILAADSRRKERNLNLENNRLLLIKQVKSAYFAVMTAQQMKAVAEESYSLATESLKVAQARFEIGQISESETLRWEANLARADAERIEAENLLAEANLVLVNLMGVPMTTRYTPTALSMKQVEMDLASIDDQSLTGFPSTSQIASHPAVLQVDQSVNLAKVDRFSSVGTLLPSANFTYTYNWQQNNTMELDGREGWTAGIQVEIPLFQSLGGVFGIAGSQKSVRKAESTKEDFLRGMLLQYYRARLTISSAKKRVASATKGTRFAKQNLGLVTEQHKLGMADNLQLIDAQFAYTTARSGQIRALGDFYNALADYEYLIAKVK